ncbi:MAG: hypothetical protein LBR73_07440 [Oscillospiraceae bacterium]|jgi:hypothetical protein|nr:hypothetical protein [Oscillospiraceae bacterium]
MNLRDVAAKAAQSGIAEKLLDQLRDRADDLPVDKIEHYLEKFGLTDHEEAKAVAVAEATRGEAQELGLHGNQWIQMVLQHFNVRPDRIADITKRLR